MPLRSVELRPGWRVMERYCDGCGVANAPFGTGRLHDVLRTKDASKFKVWCGPKGCKAANLLTCAKSQTEQNAYQERAHG